MLTGLASVSDTKIAWSDVELQGLDGALKQCRAKVISCQNEEHVLLDVSVHLSGLQCLGVLSPPSSSLPPHSLVFQMSGSYFAACQSGKVVKHAFIKPSNQVLMSYSVLLLTRLLRMHRASVQQYALNDQFLESLISKTIKKNKSASQQKRSTAKALRDQILGNTEKETETRVKEAELIRKIALKKARVDYMNEEKQQREARLKRIKDHLDSVHLEINNRTVSLMHNLHSVSKDKDTLNEWKRKYEENRTFTNDLGDTLKGKQLNLISTFAFLFPIENPDGPTPSLRCTVLPSTEEAKSNSRTENDFSVTLGMVTQLLLNFSIISDLPLRFPLRFRGSNSSVIDFTQMNEEVADVMGSCTFPLFTKGNDISKIDYALFLLNKDIAQLRWNYGLVTTNLKTTLKNVSELMSLGNSTNVISQSSDQSVVSILSPPPKNHLEQTQASINSIGRRRSREVIEFNNKKSNGQTMVRLDQQVNSNASSPSFKTCNEDNSIPLNRVKSSPTVNNSANKENSNQMNNPTTQDPSDIAWTNVTDRTSALSIPTTFQLHRKTTN